MSRISALSPLILFLCLNILSLAAAASLPCPRRGSERPPLPAVFGAPFVCARFWSAGAGIRLPNDTLSVKYGMLNTGGPTFNARGGRAFNISAELPQLTPEQSAATQQTLFKATLGAGMVIKLEAVVFVENAAMLWPFRGLRFAGNAEMLGPPTGIPAKDYLLLDFETTVRNSSTRSGLGVGELRGKFVNRNKVRRCRSTPCRETDIHLPRFLR